MKTATTTQRSLHSGAFSGFPKGTFLLVTLLITVSIAQVIHAQSAKVVSSYGPINQSEPFEQIKASRMAVKAERAQEHMALLNARYDLSKKSEGSSRTNRSRSPTTRREACSFRP